MSKYFKYAIGEIILVMIGILLALQVNNWNQKRLERTVENELVQNIINKLESDNARYKMNLTDMDSIEHVYNKLYQYGVEDMTNINIKNTHFIRRIPSFDPALNTDYSKLSDNITNKIIREGLLSYDVQQKIFEISFKEYTNSIYDLRKFLGQKGLYKLGVIFNSSKDNIQFINEDELKALAKTTDFQQLLFEAKLKAIGVKRRLKELLSDNMSLVNRINKNMDYYR